MNKSRSITLLIFILATSLALAFPSPAYAQTPDGNGKVVFGGTYELKSGETLSGNLAVFGGTASIEEDATIDGDIFIIGGYIDLDGKVTGDLVSIGGIVKLLDSSTVEGNLTSINTTIQRDPGALVQGNTTIETPGSINIEILPYLKDALKIQPETIQPNAALNIFKPFGKFLWALFKAFGLAALAMIAMLFLEKPTNRVANAMVEQPLIAGGLGLLTIIVAPVVLILLGITIILLPVSLLGLLAIAAAVLYGWIATGFEVGKRISQLFHWQASAPVSAGIGTLIMTIVVAMVDWIPCIGKLASALILMLGLGSVLMTRFGTDKKNNPNIIDVPEQNSGSSD